VFQYQTPSSDANTKYRQKNFFAVYFPWQHPFYYPISCCKGLC